MWKHSFCLAFLRLEGKKEGAFFKQQNKQYINGMNRNSILIWAMAIGTLSSCMSNEDVYDPEKIAAMKVAKYEAAFVQKYGKVDPKQDWGFGEAETAAKTVVTRSMNTQENDWYIYLEIPDLIGEDEIANVKKVFDEVVEKPQNMGIKWSDFFIQQVYEGAGTYIASDGSVVNARFQNFRYGTNETFGNNGMIDPRNVQIERNVFRNDRIIYFENEPWNGDFVCQVSYGESCTFDDHYLIKEIDGNYYVGFDFESKGQNSNQVVARDYKFNDAIFKIVPAKFKNARRIMAEDLVVDSKSDFDFNDVVFDAAIVGGEAVITLQAVGGVLPLHIGSEESEHEVHKLFGVEQNVFVNTRNKGEKAPVMFRLSGCNSLDDIAIFVDGQKIGKQLGTNRKAPAKLCCPTTYSWAPETTPIDTYFKNFANAVGDATVVWYEDGRPDPDWGEVTE